MEELSICYYYPMTLQQKYRCNTNMNINIRCTQKTQNKKYKTKHAEMIKRNEMKKKKKRYQKQNFFMIRNY